MLEETLHVMKFWLQEFEPTEEEGSDIGVI